MKAQFFLSKSKLMEQYNVIKDKCDIVSYSLKTNFEVGKLLEKDTSCLQSVHFSRNLEVLKDCSRVLFFLQGQKEEDYKELFSKGVKMFAVDNESDLKSLVTFVEKNDKKIILFLRMRMKEHTIHTGKHFVFGLSSKQVNTFVKEFKDNKSIESIGVHFHRKTQNIHEWSMQYELVDSLTQETLEAIDFLNMGGGIPVSYKNSRAERITHIFAEMKKLKEWISPFTIKLICEPGRFLAAPCITLKAEIVNIYDKTIVVNCSVYNAAMDTFVAHTRLKVEGELERGEAFTLKGCTPDSLDIFRYRVFLDKPKVGDTLTFAHTGAYNFHTDFCHLEKIETVVVE
jgi:ornithine decarboxylase